jgi:copper(I)-binding protein
MKHSTLVTLLAALGLALILTACAGSGSTAGLQITDVWGRASPAVQNAEAFYMTISNPGSAPDKLMTAMSDACGMATLHETYKKDDGTMGMRAVTGGAIDVPAGGKAELKVGGLHVMCMDKKGELKIGQKVPLTLKFEKAGEIKVEAEIREK